MHALRIPAPEPFLTSDLGIEVRFLLGAEVGDLQLSKPLLLVLPRRADVDFLAAKLLEKRDAAQHMANTREVGPEREATVRPFPQGPFCIARGPVGSTSPSVAEWIHRTTWHRVGSLPGGNGAPDGALAAYGLREGDACWVCSESAVADFQSTPQRPAAPQAGVQRTRVSRSRPEQPQPPRSRAEPVLRIPGTVDSGGQPAKPVASMV